MKIVVYVGWFCFHLNIYQTFPFVGKLTLTNCALYFDSMGGGEKAMRYDLTEDTKQVIKPELTGPLGARIFDKAIMYKSITVYVCYWTTILCLSLL